MQQYVHDFLSARVLPQQSLLLALSGGMDSMVLLNLVLPASRLLGLQLNAMHVHHGLSANADAWATFCAEQCAAAGVPFQLVGVKVDRTSGIGLEAAARQARYHALASAKADHILLAHHQGDQAETLLLQLMRGGGAKGLAAMAAQDSARRLLRPLLNVSRDDILAYAKQHQLRWVEDESNADIQFDRNFVRHQVLPVFEQRFPAASALVARSAAHLAEAAHLLDELAELDAQSASNGRQLRVSSLGELSSARAGNLLRWWLASHDLPMPSTAKLHELLSQLLGAKPDAMLKLSMNADNSIWLRRYQGWAYLDEEVAAPIAMIWQGEAELALLPHGKLLFETRHGQGLAYQRLGISKLRISHRIGGERFKPELARPTRTLKHLLQEANMPPWQRQRLPLVYCDDALAVVPSIGVASHLQAAEHEDGLVITWLEA